MFNSHPVIHQGPGGIHQCIDRSIDIIGRLSRTFKGEANTDVSALKEPLLLSGESLASTVRLNVRDAALAILEYGPRDVRCALDAEGLLYDTAVRANRGLLQPARSILRAWETGIAAHSPARRVLDDFQRFAAEFAERWEEGFVKPVQFASWIEWRSNANGHFFTDGCGRIARTFSLTALSRQRLLYPVFIDREQYFQLIGLPFGEWQREYSARIEEARTIPVKASSAP